MGWLFLIVFLSFIPLSEEQILPTNIHQTRQRILGLSHSAFTPAISWSPYLSSQTSHGNYVPSFNQMMGNVVSPSASMGMMSESKYVGEPAPKLSQQERAQAREGIAAGIDISDIAVLQNYPVHLLEQLEESLTEPSRSTNSLSSNTLNQKILSNPVRNLVGNAGNRNWPGNNIQLNKMSRLWIRNNPVGNSVYNGIQAYPQTMNAISRGAPFLVSNTGAPLLPNSPQPHFAAVNRESKIPERKTPNFVNPSVVSIIMALSRLWDKRHSLGTAGSLEEKITFHQINSMIKTLSPESKQIIMPFIQRFTLSNNVRQSLAKNKQTLSKGKYPQPTNTNGRIEFNMPIKIGSDPTTNNNARIPRKEQTVLQSTDFTTNQNSISSGELSSISTVSQMTQLEKPSPSFNNSDSKLRLLSTRINPHPEENLILVALHPRNKVHLNQKSLSNSNFPAESKLDKSNKLSSQPSMNEGFNLLHSPASSVILHNELSKSLISNTANSNSVPRDAVKHQTTSTSSSTTVNTQSSDAVASSPLSMSSALLPDSNTRLSLPRVNHASLSNSENKGNYLSILPNMLQSPDAANKNDALSKADNAQSLDAVNITDTVSSVLNIIRPFDTVNANPSVSLGHSEQSNYMINTGALPSSNVNINRDSIIKVNSEHPSVPRAASSINTIQVNQAPPDTTQLDSSVPSPRVINISKLNKTQSPETSTDSAVSNRVPINTGQLNQASPGTTNMNNIVHSGNVPTDIIKRNSPQSPDAINTNNNVSNVPINTENVKQTPLSHAITNNSVSGGLVLTTVTNTRNASSRTTDVKDNTKASAVVSGRSHEKGIAVTSAGTTSLSGRNAVAGSRSATQPVETSLTSASLVKHKVIQATWKAFSKSLRDMLAYGNLLLSLTHNVINSQSTK